MELRNVLTFVAASKLKSFSKVADQLGYAQSTITTQIQQLERELGQPLFDRINHSIYLTHFGEQILPLAEKMADLAQEIKLINATPKTTSGRLPITGPESVLYGGFLQLSLAFRSIYPGIQLELATASSVELPQMLLENKTDLILTLGNTDAEENLRKVYLTTSPVVWVASKNHPLASSSSISLDEIAREQLILTENISIYYKMVMSLFHKHALYPQPVIQIKNTRAIVDLLSSSNAVSFLPIYTLKSDTTQNLLSILKVNSPEMHINITGVVNRNKWISPQLQFFINLLNNKKWLL